MALNVNSTNAFIAKLTATDVLTADDYALASTCVEPTKLEMFEHLRDIPSTYFVQLATDNRNAPLIRAGEIVVVDQGGPQRGGWQPTDGGLFVIEYRGTLNDYPDQRYPRVSQEIVQTFRDQKGLWWAGAMNKGIVGKTFHGACGPYRDECHLADRLIGRVVGILSSSMIGAA